MENLRQTIQIPGNYSQSNGRTRVTQRAPQSCQRCSAKKMRCSKTVPCDSCVAQGMASQCRREQVIVTKHIRSAKTHQQLLKSASDALKPTRPSAGSRPAAFDYQLPRDASPNHEETAAVLLGLAQHQHANSDDMSFGEMFGAAPQSPNEGSNKPNAEANSAESNYREGYHNWTGLGECDTGNSVSSPQDEVSPFEATVTSLEFMVWGRQRDSEACVSTTLIPVQADLDSAIVSPEQAVEIIKYHWKWLAWTHNVIHWPQFQEECQLYWNEGFIKEKAWLALYYSVICAGLHHMSMEKTHELGFPPDTNIAEETYHKCIDCLNAADYASDHSLVTVQTVCLLVLCAPDFNGSNLLAVLLSSAIRIAQALNVHRLGPDPVDTPSYRERVQREMRKSIWLFLSTQDWFMIPFSNSHSIYPSYCTTPAPINCDAISGIGANDQRDPFKVVSMERPTLMSYQLIMNRVASVYRNFFDQTSFLPGDLDSDSAMRRLYDQVLDADAKINAIIKSLPRYLRVDNVETCGRLPCYMPQQRYHFAISVAHKTLSIHRRFFLKSLTDRWYNYTKITCVDCARTILTQFKAISSDSTSKNLWTVLAHVVSAALILVLETMFSDNSSATNDSTAKRQLVCDCLVILRANPKSSSMSGRGMDLIELLLSRSSSNQNPGPHLSSGTTEKLDLNEIAAYLALDKSASTTSRAESYSGAVGNDVLDFDFSDMDKWTHYLS